MTARSQASYLRRIIEEHVDSVIRARTSRFDWRVVTDVQARTATVVDGLGNESFGIRWFELRPKVGDRVLVELPPPGGTRRIVAIDREIAK